MVAMSHRRLSWGIHSLPRAASDWRWKTIVGHKLGSLLGSRYLEIRYEELVARPAEVLSQVCAFLGVDTEAALLNYPARAACNLPAESVQWHRNSIRSQDATRIFEWKRRMSRSDRIIFEQVAGDALAMFGYEFERLPPTVGSRLRSVYYAMVQRW
jgi:hypothetical protein